MDKINKNQPNFFLSRDNLPINIEIIESYEKSVEEYFYISNPHIKKNSVTDKARIIEELDIADILIYYPWHKIAVHTVSEDIYYKLRTARNKNIITEKEQIKYRDLRIGIVGLSVGSNALSALVYTGGPKNIRIADFDTIEISNLNRIRATLLDIGKNKAIIAARNTWEVDPFAKIDIWENGVSDKTLKNFILKDKIDLFIDTMDDLYLKIQARLLCKKYRIPVLMITENGDNTILDIERYDLEDIPIFQGKVDSNNIKKYSKFTQKQWLSLALKIIDPDYLTEEMQTSILNIGKSIAGVPQIATSVNIGGSAIAYAVRRIANNYKLPTGRYVIGLENKLRFNNLSKKQASKKTTGAKKLKRMFNLD